jgi:hypothetical protein
MSLSDNIQIAANIATVLACPLGAWAVYAYFAEQRKENELAEENVFIRLNRSYDDFLDRLLAHPDVYLTTKIGSDANLEARRQILYEGLISCMELAFILLYTNDSKSDHVARMQATWLDWMKFWCRREDFRTMLPQLLEGEDPLFVAFITSVNDDVKAEIAAGVVIT